MIKKLFIYRIRHIDSGKSYIGWTINTRRRWRRHVNSAKSGSINAVHCAIRFHGESAFSFEIVETLEGEESEARRREVHWIASEGTLSPLGYNMTEGGDGADGLGRLAAAAHKARRAIDPDADADRRRQSYVKGSWRVSAEARSLNGKRAWNARPIGERQAAVERLAAYRATLSAEERANLSRCAARSGSAEERSQRARNAALALSPDQKKAAVVAMRAGLLALSAKERAEIGKLGQAARMAATTNEQRSEALRRRWQNTTAEQKAEIARKQAAKFAAKSPEEIADIGKRRWETRRRKAALEKQLE